MSIFDESQGTINLGSATPELVKHDDSPGQDVNGDDDTTVDTEKHGTASRTDTTSLAITTFKDYDIIVTNNIVVLGDKGIAGELNWRIVLDVLPGEYIAGLRTTKLWS